MFRHFLLTRFNLRVEDWKTTKNGSRVLSDTWLIDRFNLFETYCLPSVKNQKNQNFTWFVYFDIDTPPKFKHKIKQLANAYSNFNPVYIDAGVPVFRQAIINNIKASISEKDQYIITTRMDNDDMIHHDFINTIQSLFKPVHKHIIDLRIGYQLIMERNKGEVLHHKNDFNPFISLVEKTGDINSVFSRDHKRWRDAVSVTVHEKKQLWMALIHRNNKLNTRNRKSKGMYTFNCSDFGIEKEHLNLKSPVNVFFSNLQVDLRSRISLFKRMVNKSKG